MSSQRKDCAVLFDLDGTLWDATDRNAESWNQVFCENGYLRRTTGEELRRLQGKPIYEIGYALFPETDRKEICALMDQCAAHDAVYLAQTGGRLYDGVIPMLKNLSKQAELCVISNCQDGYIQAFLTAHGLTSLFSDFECPGRSGKLKAENIRLVMNRNQYRRAVYIGDTEWDQTAAQTAGVPFIRAAYGFGKFPSVFTAEVPSQLPELVKKILFS